MGDVEVESRFIDGVSRIRRRTRQKALPGNSRACPQDFQGIGVAISMRAIVRTAGR